jgi:hypothetical protein
MLVIVVLISSKMAKFSVLDIFFISSFVREIEVINSTS